MKRVPDAGCSMSSATQEGATHRGRTKAQLATPYAFASSTAHSSGIEVIYVALNSGDATRHADDLRAFGFEVSVYTNIAAVCSALPPEAAPLIALQAEPATVHLAVAQLRLTFHHAGIVVIADFPDRLSRVGAMLSGADSCVEAMPDSLELMAALLASKRRLQVEDLRQKEEGASKREAKPGDDLLGTSDMASEAGSDGRWQLENYGWILAAPNGTRLELNHAERKIMAQFFKNPQEPLTRMSQGASYNPENGKITRGLDVAISRLKKKAAVHQVRLPIRSIRGKGYVFASNEPLDIEAEEEGDIRS